MKTKLIINGISKLVLGFVLIATLLFLPAGTWCYTQAWLFIALLFIPMTIMGVWLYLFQPELLAKRLNNKEKEKEQKSVVSFSGLMFIAGFVLCGLDYRFGWSVVPLWLTISASLIFLLGYAMYAEVMRRHSPSNVHGHNLDVCVYAHYPWLVMVTDRLCNLSHPHGIAYQK